MLWRRVLAFGHGAFVRWFGRLVLARQRLLVRRGSSDDQSQGHQRQHRGVVPVDLFAERLQARGDFGHAIGAAVLRRARVLHIHRLSLRPHPSGLAMRAGGRADL